MLIIEIEMRYGGFIGMEEENFAKKFAKETPMTILTIRGFFCNLFLQKTTPTATIAIRWGVCKKEFANSPQLQPATALRAIAGGPCRAGTCLARHELADPSRQARARPAGPPHARPGSARLNQAMLGCRVTCRATCCRYARPVCQLYSQNREFKGIIIYNLLYTVCFGLV